MGKVDGYLEDSIVNKTVLTSSLVWTFVAIGPVLAEDADSLFIFKKVGEMPQVDATSVDRLGASAVHELLGENYIVFHGTRAALSATSTDPVEPIVPDDIPDDDPLPICQCPEDYRAALTQRFSAPQMQDLLRRERMIMAPAALPSLQADQIQTLEKMIQHQGPLILQEQ